MSSPPFDSLSTNERDFLERLSKYSSLRQREKIYSSHKLSKTQKINFIYENRVYLNSEDRMIMNKLARDPVVKLKENGYVYGASVFVSFLFNVGALTLSNGS